MKQYANYEKIQRLSDIINYLPLFGYSLCDVSERINIPKSTLYDYKAGKRITTEKYDKVMNILSATYPFEVMAAQQIAHIVNETKQSQGLIDDSYF